MKMIIEFDETKLREGGVKQVFEALVRLANFTQTCVGEIKVSMESSSPEHEGVFDLFFPKKKQDDDKK